MPRLFDLAHPLSINQCFCGYAHPLLLAQQGDAPPSDVRLLVALLVLVGLGLVLVVTLLILLLVGRSRRTRLLAEEAKRRREAIGDIDAWAEAGRRIDPDAAGEKEQRDA